MSRTINTNWLTAAREEPRRPVHLVTFRWGNGTVEGTDQLTFADRPGTGYAASVEAVGAVARSIDPLTREFTVSTVSVSMRRDPSVRLMVKRYRLRNKQMVVRVGFVGLAEADYIPIATMRIKDYPSDEHAVHFSATTLLGGLAEKKAKLSVVNRHPSQALLTLFTISGVPSAAYDASTLAYDYFPEIGHWNISRHNPPTAEGWQPSPNLQEDSTLRELTNPLLQILSGTLVENGDGVARLTRYDKDAAPVTHWERRQVLDFKSLSVTDEIYNSFVTKLGRNASDYLYTCTIGDTVSQANHAYPGEGSETSEFTFSSDWLNGVGQLFDAQPVPVGSDAGLYVGGTDFIVMYAGLNGFCGARFLGNAPTTPPAGADLSGGRTAYLMFTGRNVRVEDGRFVEDVPEIVKVSTCEVATEISGSPILPTTTKVVIADDFLGYPKYLRFTLDSTADNGGRSQFTDTPNIPDRWKSSALVVDVTIPVEMMLRAMERYADGAPEAEIRVNIDQAEICAGDFVTLADDVYLAYGYDGAESTTVWEVVSDEMHAVDDAPGIIYRLRKVRDDGTHTTSPVLLEPSSGIGFSGLVLVNNIITKRDGTNLTTRAGELVTQRGT